MPDNLYHHGDLKQQLIREGLRLLDTAGYDGLTLRKVAKACNVSQTAPYRHFKNKDELIAAITMQAMASLMNSSSSPPGSIRTIRRRRCAIWVWLIFIFSWTIPNI